MISGSTAIRLDSPSCRLAAGRHYMIEGGLDD